MSDGDDLYVETLKGLLEKVKVKDKPKGDIPLISPEGKVSYETLESLQTVYQKELLTYRAFMIHFHLTGVYEDFKAERNK